MLTCLIEKAADNIAAAIDAAGLDPVYSRIGIINRRKAAVAEQETVLNKIAIVKIPTICPEEFTAVASVKVAPGMSRVTYVPAV